MDAAVISRQASIRFAAVLLTSLSLLGEDAKTKPVAVEQPLPFSHKQHVTLGLNCSDCHRSPDPGEKMTLPPTSKCMDCHATIAKDKLAIQKLAEFAKSREAVPWIQLYKVPDWVWFSHRTHLEAGARCDDCHGPVAQRDALWKEVNLNMDTCMNCHRKNNATLDCNACHEAH